MYQQVTIHDLAYTSTGKNKSCICHLTVYQYIWTYDEQWVYTQNAECHCSCGGIFSRHPPAARGNKTAIRTRSVGGRYNNITAGGDESNFPTREIGIHTIAHSWDKKCMHLLFYSSSSTSGGNVGLFEHKVVLCSPFIFSMGLQEPVINKVNFKICWITMHGLKPQKRHGIWWVKDYLYCIVRTWFLVIGFFYEIFSDRLEIWKTLCHNSTVQEYLMHLDYRYWWGTT
jgi:hypothetical protein